MNITAPNRWNKKQQQRGEFVVSPPVASPRSPNNILHVPDRAGKFSHQVSTLRGTKLDESIENNATDPLSALRGKLKAPQASALEKLGGSYRKEEELKAAQAVPRQR